MRSLNDVQKINAYKTGHACLSVCLSAWFNSRTAGRIWMKFCMDIMPLETTFQFSTIGNTNMPDEQTCEVVTTLAPLAVGSYSDV
jgi:hypothetical protein